MAVIDGKNMIAGRLATIIAKRALAGEEIDIVNTEEIVITGSKDKVIQKFTQRRERGIPLKGPYYPKDPERIFKRIVRGMLPYKKSRGREAFERVKCHIGIPSEFSNSKIERIESADVSKIFDIDFVFIKDISKVLGSKIVARMEQIQNKNKSDK